jgi:chorismate synthase
LRPAVKPTPSIAKIQTTRDIHGNATEIRVGGRHDPCILPWILPVAEAMLALVLTTRCWSRKNTGNFFEGELTARTFPEIAGWAA